MHLALTWDWVADLTREFNKINNEELQELSEQLSPFAEYYLHNVVTILRDDDIQQLGQWSEKTLSERYVENLAYLKAAEPKRGNVNQETIDKSYIASDFATEDSMHSDNWVIHGNYTATGKPMLANDPHLAASIPSFWQLNELVWGDKFLSGGSGPGFPLIAVGMGKFTSYGQTSPNCDSSDLWQETIDEETQSYLVDNEWRKLNIIHELIKVKGQE